MGKLICASPETEIELPIDLSKEENSNRRRNLRRAIEGDHAVVPRLTPTWQELSESSPEESELLESGEFAEQPAPLPRSNGTGNRRRSEQPLPTPPDDLWDLPPLDDEPASRERTAPERPLPVAREVAPEPVRQHDLPVATPVDDRETQTFPDPAPEMRVAKHFATDDDEVIVRKARRPMHLQNPQAKPAPVHQVGDILLTTEKLQKIYDGRAVVDGVDVNVRESEIVGLLGPNGAGKTTTFYMIVGLIQPNGGKVCFEGKDTTKLAMFERARLGMGYLPQEESIFRKMTVEENILAVLETQRRFNRRQRRQRCDELMEQFGIQKLAKNVAITLSGGEKRRLTIARSLVTDPKLLMLDEPFSGVDPIAVGEIQEIIRGLRDDGISILITDHNVRETLNIVDRAYLLFEGRVRREGSRDFLTNDPLSRKLYLGEDFSM